MTGWTSSVQGYNVLPGWVWAWSHWGRAENLTDGTPLWRCSHPRYLRRFLSMFHCAISPPDRNYLLGHQLSELLEGRLGIVNKNHDVMNYGVNVFHSWEEQGTEMTLTHHSDTDKQQIIPGLLLYCLGHLINEVQLCFVASALARSGTRN